LTSRSFHPVADAQPPVDRVVRGAGLAVDQAPARVRRRRHPVDVDHVVFPLDAARIGLRLRLVRAVPAAVPW
jgi:hypothetical protein